MEEILASIRRIIAEDQAAPQSPPVPPLTASLRLADPVQPVAPAPSAQVTALSPREPPRREEAPAQPAPQAPAAPLVSAGTASAVGDAFERLAATPVPPPLRSLEEAVSEMLRPMLKSWLDDNLPALVERLVKAEIERLTRAAR
jgi:cell pole-organizing protein PopZ